MHHDTMCITVASWWHRLFLYVWILVCLLVYHERGAAVSSEPAGQGIDRLVSTMTPPWKTNPFINYEIDARRNYVFIHACVGIFKKKRGGGTWGHGEDILVELLDTIVNSTLPSNDLGGVFVGMLGSASDIEHTKVILLDKYSKINGPLRDRVHVIATAHDIELSEFPTLLAMQLFANRAPAATKLAYLHTKGVRKNGINDYPSEWRRYMSYFVVHRYEICFEALDKQAYCTCGPLKQSKIYAGNFWWTKAGYLATRTPRIAEIEWNVKNRYLAEEYILRNQSSPSNQVCSRPGSDANPQNLHYCVHHTHHVMQVCHTPFEWYSNVSSQLRSNPQCFFRKLSPANPKKNDPLSWCHNNGLPVIPST
jgi:hypothetical protein